jgi:hypothetical protein
MEIEDLLEPGERLLWEGRPIGYPPLLPRGGCVIHVLPAILLTLACLLYPPLIMAFPTSGRGPSVALPFLGSSTHVLALLVLAPIALGEATRIVQWRRVRYGISDRRVLVVGLTADGLGLHRVEVARSTIARVSLRGRDVVIEGSWPLPLRFAQLADPEAARSALGM